MSEPEEPLQHLLDEEGSSSLLRSALRGARGDLPDAAKMDAISSAIAGAIGKSPGAGGASMGVKIAIGAGVVAVLAGVAILATRPGAPTPPAPAPSASVIPSAMVAPPPATTTTPPAIDVNALPSAAKTAAPTASVSAPAASLADEMALLQRAQAALVRSPAEALARCDEAAATYPKGSLVEEREVIAIDALLRLGRRGEAESRAARFRSAHPGSAYGRRLDVLLGSD